MSKGKAIALGLLTIWPPVYMVLFFCFVLLTMFTAGGSGSEPPIGFFLIFPFHMFTMVAMFALLGIYIVLVIKNKALEDNMRIIWVILVIMLGIGAMPVYWWLHVWNTPEEVES